MNIKQTPLRQRYCLHLIQTACQVISQITQVLLVLASKRLTLTEKAIRSELYACAQCESKLISILMEINCKSNYGLRVYDGHRIRQINSELSHDLLALINAANHSLNYMEQYFEHDFYSRLYNNKFAEQLADILTNLGNVKPSI